MIRDKVILVTGVGGGIGQEILKELSPKVQVLITSSRTAISKEKALENAVIGDHLCHFAADLTAPDNIIHLFRYIKEIYGRLDGFINTIGGSLFSHKIEDFPIDEFDKVMMVNLRTAFLLTQAAIKTMKHNRPIGGNIVHFVSSSAKLISKNKAPYGIAKAGLAHLIHYAAEEAAEYDIKVNGITPTYVFTARHEEEIKIKAEKIGKSRDKIAREMMTNQLIKRPLYPKDLMPIIELLLTTEVITGQIYDVSLGEVLNY